VNLKVTWYTTPQQAWPKYFTNWANNARKAIAALLLSYAPRIESWMKENAIWEDQTGNARQSLYASMETVSEQVFMLYWGHGMSYGVFLEMSNQGRFGILSPALDYFYPQIVADIQRLFS
jgi:hypothetical protein